MRDSKAAGCPGAPRRGSRLAGLALSALALTMPAFAGQTSSSFNVRVELRAAGDTGVCETATEPPERPSTVTIDCHGTPLPAAPVDVPVARPTGTPFRFHIPSGFGDQRFGEVDLQSGTATITSWRVVRLADWDYLEMTVGW